MAGTLPLRAVLVTPAAVLPGFGKNLASRRMRSGSLLAGAVTGAPARGRRRTR
ncbi:hypothetical protein ACIBSW_02755 [Actinoplanes sp. NPDC049668]|uniref:hypothetical protein n=1 Tax=unclassified Actinoplanes TaxID=2626549 RepID=UPI00339EA6A0